jgi:oligopeptide transport system substrate-binding protein
VELEGPAAYLLYVLAQTSTRPIPRHVVEAHGPAWENPENLVTNGPFTLQSWRPGESMVLVRYPHYHGRFRGNVRQVELSLIPAGEWLAEQEMYDADQLDALWLYSPPEDTERMLYRHAGEYMSPHVARVGFLVFDASRVPFRDPRVRRAFAYAVDRETLAHVILGRQFTPATGGCVPPGLMGHLPGIALPHDQRRARELLAEAGHPQGGGFPPVDYLTLESNADIARHLCAGWTETLGVEIRQVAVRGWQEYLDLVLSGGPHLWIMGWAYDYPDPDQFLRVCLQKWSAWRHEPYLDRVEAARRALGPDERVGLYTEAEQILVREVPVLPLYYRRSLVLLKPWVKRYPISVHEGTYWKDVIIEPR